MFSDPSDPRPAKAAGAPEAIAAELAALLDAHIHDLRSRGVSEDVLAPLEIELRTYSQGRLAG